MRWRVLVVLSLVILLTCSCFAAEEAQPQSGGDQAHDDAPGLFSGGLGDAIFTLAVFIALWAILRKWAWGPLLSGLRKREDYIRNEIEQAAKARDNADEKLRQYETQLAKAHDDAQAIIDNARAEATKSANEFKAQSHAQAQDTLAKTQADIASAKDQALKEIYDQSTKIATDLAGRILQRELKPEDHHALLQQSIGRLNEDISRN